MEGQRLLQRLVDEGLEKTAVALLGSAHDEFVDFDRCVCVCMCVCVCLCVCICMLGT